MDDQGEVITHSQNQILQALSCSLDEPAIEPLDNHHDIVKSAVMAASNSSTSYSGILGTKNSVKYRVVSKLDSFMQSPEAQACTEDYIDQIKLAMDDIYNQPMLENTKFILGRIIKTATTKELIQTILDMRSSGNLCRNNEERLSTKQAGIICSMGLK